MSKDNFCLSVLTRIIINGLHPVLWTEQKKKRAKLHKINLVFLWYEQHNKNDILLWKRRLWMNKTFAFSMSPRLIGWNVVIPFHKNLCQQCHMIPCAEVISSWPRCHNIFFVPWNQIGKLANFKIIDIDFNLKSSILSRNGWKMYHQVEWVFSIQVLCKQH